jgi:hypothetical protein
MKIKLFALLVVTMVFARTASADKIVAEAESYNSIQPSMELIADKEASGGKAIQVPLKEPHGMAKPADNGYAEYKFVTPHGGTYQFWARCWFVDNKGKSFYVLVDSDQVTSKTPTVTGATMKSWRWVAGPVVKLDAGSHTIRIQYKEDGAKMDEWVLTTTLKNKWQPTAAEAETAQYLIKQK